MKPSSNRFFGRLKQTALGFALVLLVSIVGSCGASKMAGTIVDATRVPDLSFSPQLSPYLPHPTARSRTADEIYDRTANPSITLPPEYAAKRKEIVRMYQAAGFDLSLDKEELRKLRPTAWSPMTPQPLAGNYPQPYSIDAPFYHKIPSDWPRVQLPIGYVQTGHISTLGPPGDGSDGFGIGLVISKATDPVRRISLANGAYAKTGVCPQHNPFKGYNTTTRIRNSANVLLGGNGEGVPYQSSDRTVIWLDSSDNTIVSTWISSPDCDRPDLGTKLGDWSGEAVTPKEKLPNLGDQWGINAAAKSDLVALIRPGEAIDPERPIPHALTGPVDKAWKAIVYPANNVDNSIDQNNRGLLGYGFLVQLDPNFDLKKLKLSLPARRILEAIQTYGWYMDDTGVRDFDIKGNFSGAEFAPYGGVKAVDAEILAVLKTQKLFVVPPLVKK
ncbi:hypothetical protein [Altericista sp. CCNU0014]|uniref:hypothetical protein n=1 Tax=Altericista sp. CCNU0014 TaxID=3082949 RepID=UPI00384B9241